MTPLLLEMEGFTCYRERAVVDFSAATTGLFAVTGPTGAGKSTILDAITYVLYGQTARLGGRGMEALISPGAQRLAVQLTFRAARGVYRATRTAQRRSSSLASEVRIEESTPDGAWRQLPASEKVRDANRALEELVGLDYDGFTRAVLLPQGAFDEFLRGDATQRRRLLVTLLGLDRVSEIQRLAGVRARDAETAANGIKTRLEEDYADADAGTLRKVRDEAAELQRQLEEGARQLVQLQEAHDAALETAKLERDLATVRAELEQLAGDKATVNERRSELAAARRAALIAPLLPQVENSERLSARADAELQRLQGVKVAALEAQSAVTATLRAAQERADGIIPRAEAEVTTLERVAPAYRLLLQRSATLAAKVNAERADYLDEERWNRWQTAESHIPALRRANAEVELAARNLEKAHQDAKSAAESVTAIRKKVEDSLQRGRELRAEQAAARTALEEVQRADMAAALRKQLVAGEPCPVCGAPGHEKRRHDLRDNGTELDLDAAKDRLTTATQEVESAVEQHQLLTAKLASSEASATAAVERVNSTTAAATRARESQLGAVELLATHGLAPAQQPPDPDSYSAELKRQRVAALAAHALALSNELEEAGTPLDERFDLDERLGALKDEVASLSKGVADAKHALEEADRKVRSAEVQLSAAETTASERRAEAAQAAAAVAEAVQAAGFTDEAAAQQAQRSASHIAELEAFIAQHESQLLAAERRLVELSADLAKRPASEGATASELVETLRPRLLEQRQAIDEQRGQLGALEHRCSELEERIERAKKLRKDLAALQDSFELHRQLQLDLRGDRFQEHLMTQVQERLARRASHILRQVTEGRFDLLLADGDYAVFDAWSDGEQRSVRTLSGGESFVASLALALALSDTLVGSAALGALFLDEGFGTLDRETLDAVATVLESLTDEGRMVGVITHVPELSERLPARLVVSKGPSGSTVAWDI